MPSKDLEKLCQGRPAMKITGSSIQMSAETSALERHERHESLTLWKGRSHRQTIHGDGGGDLGNEAKRQAKSHGAALSVSISNKALRGQAIPRGVEVRAARPEPGDQLKIDILKALIEKLTGRKIEIKTPDEVVCPDQEAEGLAEGTGEASDGFGMIYDYYESHYERQDMTFSATGTISTVDGKQVDFSVDLSMTREFYTEQHIQLRAGDALKDPLSVNFSGTAAELTNTKFSFDLDADGRKEQVSFVRPGSGFLALDRNGDGKINDGTELFGATTGDGFSELARFDADGNDFIDEGDPIYNRLRIWEKDRDGHDRLLALGQAGIGAIYLGNVPSAFDLKDQSNNLLGRVNSTGLFIREDGSAGTIQQLDLVV